MSVFGTKCTHDNNLWEIITLFSILRGGITTFEVIFNPGIVLILGNIFKNTKKCTSTPPTTTPQPNPYLAFFTQPLAHCNKAITHVTEPYSHNPSLILHLSLNPLTHCHTCYSCNSTKRTQFKPLFHSASQSDSYNSRQLAYGVVGHFHTM